MADEGPTGNGATTTADVVDADRSPTEAAADVVDGDRSPTEATEAIEARGEDPAALGREAGKPFDRGHPYLIGLTAGLGLITAYLLFRAVVDVAAVLVIIGLSLFLAVGFDPIVTRLSRRLPRLVAVLIVVAIITGVIVGFVAAALPPMAHEAAALTKAWPRYRQQIQTGQGWLGRLAVKTHLNTYLVGRTGSGGGTSSLHIDLLGGVVGAGKLLVSAFSSLVAVLVLTLYFMVTLPTVRNLWLRFIPASRRPRAAVFTDQAFLRVGGFVLGNILTSVVAAAGTVIWALIFGLPYPLLLGLLVALLDLIPVVGSTVGGVVVALVALSQGVTIAIATAVFYLVYRFLEDHLLNPLVFRRTVHVSAGLSIVATLVGGALLGLLGALVAVPIAATLQVILEQVTFPSLEQR